MAVIETWFEQDLQKPVKVRYIDGNLFSHNGNGNRIGVIVTNNGDPVTLTGTVSGYAVLADGTTVPCTGTRSGNKASILVPAAAYSPGSILISIFLTDGTTVTTLAALSSSVIMARTGNQIDPGSVVTDWTNTINAAMQSVETAAANLGNIIATPYANLTFPVPLGAYTIYNNGLYRCISPIASSEAWTAAHWTNVKLGDDVRDLKSALSQFQPNLFPSYYPVQLNTGFAVKSADGRLTTLSSYSYSPFFKVIPGTTIRLRNYINQASETLGLAFYTTPSDYTFISGVTYDTVDGIDAIVPSNANYCRVTVHNNYKESFSFSYNIEPWVTGIEKDATEAKSKTDIIGYGKNLFDKSAITPERYLNASGNPTYNATMCVSDFIPVEEGKTYQISFEWNAWVYDANKTGLRNVSIHNIFTAQSGDAFLRITVSNANVDVAQVEESLFQSKYQSFGYKVSKEDLYFDDVSASPDNMFNPNDMTRGYMNGTTGAVSSSSANYWVTDYLGVEKDKIYTVSGMWGSLCIYNADGTFSRSVEKVGEEFPVCTFKPTGTESFVRFTVYGANKSICKFEENLGYSKYTEAVSGIVEVGNIVGDSAKVTHVYVGSLCYFKTINDANNAIADNSKYNRYVIHIFEGEYRETFRTKDWVDYVGDNKHQCIINYVSDDESDYVNRSTIFAETNSRIANLTIRTTGSKYPIHADANYGLPYVVTIEDCIIKHDGYADTSVAPGGTGVGIGLHYDQHIILRRCVIAGTTDVFGVAAVYCHNDNQNQNNWWARRERSLTIENCILQDSYYGVRWQSLESVDGQDNDFTYIGNVNTCEKPFYYEPGTYDSWHYFGLMNTPEYTPAE